MKIGVDGEHVQAVNNNYNGGAGQRIYKLRTSAGIIYYRHRYYVNDRAAGYNRDDPIDVADCPAAHLGAGHVQHVVLRARLVESWRRTDGERRNPLGRAERS